MTGGTLPGTNTGADDPDRVVLHVDMDCFYASCERLRDASLRGEPLVIGMGYESGETIGAVATASYEARQYGVNSAMPISEALERLPRRGSDDRTAGVDAEDNGDNDLTDNADRDSNLDHDDNVDRDSNLDRDDNVNTDHDSTEEGATGTNTNTENAAETVLNAETMGEAETEPKADTPPTGIYRPVDHDYYKEVAADVKDILHDCADTVREVSIDEAYLDVTDRTGWTPATASAVDGGENESSTTGAPPSTAAGPATVRTVAEGYARYIKSRIQREVGLPASVGVAPNMSTAKIASDADKPDGLVVVPPGTVESFLEPLPTADLHGVGPVTERRLAAMDIETAGDVAAADSDKLAAEFGDRGRELYDRARGEDDRDVTPTGLPKSLSRESSLPATADETRKRETISALAADVAHRARERDCLYRTIGIKVVEPPYDVNTRARSLPGPVDDPELVETVALDLLTEFTDVRARKLGVRVSNLDFGEGDQVTLGGFDDESSSRSDVNDSSSGSLVQGPRRHRVTHRRKHQTLDAWMDESGLHMDDPDHTKSADAEADHGEGSHAEGSHAEGSHAEADHREGNHAQAVGDDPPADSTTAPASDDTDRECPGHHTKNGQASLGDWE